MAKHSDNPDVFEAAERLRREIASWRDDLKARQRKSYSEGRKDLIDRLGDDYRRVKSLALMTEPEPDELDTDEVRQ